MLTMPCFSPAIYSPATQDVIIPAPACLPNQLLLDEYFATASDWHSKFSQPFEASLPRAGNTTGSSPVIYIALTRLLNFAWLL